MIGSGNGFLPVWCQAISSTNADLLPVKPLKKHTKIWRKKNYIQASVLWYIQVVAVFHSSEFNDSWWHHQMETFSALLAICGEFTGPREFPAQRPVTQSFDVFFDLHFNKQLSNQSWGWWFEMPSRPSWRHCNVNEWYYITWSANTIACLQRKGWFLHDILHFFNVSIIKLRFCMEILYGITLENASREIWIVAVFQKHQIQIDFITAR